MTSASDDQSERQAAKGTEPSAAEGQRSFVAPVTALAFVAFLVVEALAGEPAAGIVFLGMVVAAVLVIPAVGQSIERTHQTRRHDIETAARLAADLAVQQAGEQRDA